MTHNSQGKNSYFSTAYLRDIGTFQDGGLQDNFAAGIARRISRRIWPSRPGIARLISMGTGKVESSPERSPHYRHVFYDSFLRRGFDAWMSNLDTHSKWLHMMDEVDDRIKEDYLRFDVSLKDIPSAIDNAEAMDDYRNLVILQPGSSRMARQAATALLIARFFFVVDKLPREEPSGPQIRYHGSIRCKGPTMPVLEALLRLHSQEMEFVTDTTTLGKFQGRDDICASCKRYCKPLSVVVGHPDEVFNVYLRVDRHERWRISGFPSSMSSFIAQQQLQSPFGRSDHSKPSAIPCSKCASGGEEFVDNRRKRTKTSMGEEPARKRACIVLA